MTESKRILLVEDDPDQILVYQSKFELEGFILFVADEMKKAIDSALHDKPDLILLDLLLKNENGLNVLTELKKNPKTKDIPVIVFTNFDTEKTKDEAMELGAVKYVVKAQVTPTEITQIIKDILD